MSSESGRPRPDGTWGYSEVPRINSHCGVVRTYFLSCWQLGHKLGAEGTTKLEQLHTSSSNPPLVPSTTHDRRTQIRPANTIRRCGSFGPWRRCWRRPELLPRRRAGDSMTRRFLSRARMATTFQRSTSSHPAQLGTKSLGREFCLLMCGLCEQVEPGRSAVRCACSADRGYAED